MRKFIITSQKVQGQIELSYQNESLSIIDFSMAIMTDQQKEVFKSRCPLRLEQLATFVEELKLMCVESAVEISFEMFWDKYGYKVDKKRSKAIWDKLSQNEKVKAFYGVDKYKRSLKRTDWRTQMEPKTYLRNERWEDEWR